MLVFAVAAAVLAFFGLKYIDSFQTDVSDGFERQETEESLADDYIDYLVKHASELDSQNSSPTENEGESEAETKEPETIGWFDENYLLGSDGNRWTPAYASGYLAFVLEYPNIKLRRGVYCASSYREIEKDFDMWMTVLYNPQMELGKTHLWILGHNSLTQDLSFNNVRQAKIGDTFMLYGTSGVYTYEVTDIFCEWRESVNEKYVTNMSLPNTYCYIATCGRDDMYLPDGTSTRYRDFIIKGELTSHISLTEYGELLLEDENKWRETTSEK
jgi:LPXTG-site transpeptidase (sortase) family protein